MCGISGILHPFNDGDIQKMNGVLKHRGPDNCDTYIDKNIEMGHTRLSIIDLSSDANQPMQIDDFVIVFNGEIYNYVELRDELKSNGIAFKTQSDTEVLLQTYMLWGKNCLSKLNGMFAFAIWNKKSKRLFCVRDRLGEKPFYYYWYGRSFIFSSEIKPILEIINSVSPNYQVIRQYLLQGNYGMPNETFFKDVHSLLPGYWMEVDEYGGSSSFPFWGLDFNIDKFQDGEEEKASNQYLELMSDSIRLRLRSDVPIGINVSGGLDSSSLLGIIDYYYKHKTKFHVYTYTCGDERYDEVPYVKQLLNNTNHIWDVCLFKESEFYDALNEMQWYFDEPFGGLPTLAYSRIFKKAKEDGIMVLLAGEGMDEQWAGYDYYLNSINQDVNKVSVVQNSKNPTVNVLNNDFANKYEDISYPSPFKNNLDNLKYRDFIYTKIPRSLRFLDRISMAYGTEARVPFLDYRLVELSFRMPNSFLIRNGIRKYLLRQLVKKMMPSNLVECGKRPLQTPQREWMRNDTYGWIKDIINSKSFSERGIFNMEKVRKTYGEYQNGKFDNSFFLWQWVNLEVWFRTFIDSKI